LYITGFIICLYQIISLSFIIKKTSKKAGFQVSYYFNFIPNFDSLYLRPSPRLCSAGLPQIDHLLSQPLKDPSYNSQWKEPIENGREGKSDPFGLENSDRVI
jgi:hypothetical protein